MPDGPFLGARGPFPTPNPSVGVAVAVPALSNATHGTPTSTGATNAQVDTTIGNGTLYWAVVLSTKTATDTQVKNGGGDVIVHGSQSVSGTGTQTVASITGLTTATNYLILYLQTNSIGSDSAQASVSLTTS